MSLLRRASLLVVLVATSSACGSPPKPEKRDHGELAAPLVERATELTIIGTNDLHGHIEMLPILGGYLDIVRAQPERAVVLVDGGDMFQGTLASNLVEGAPIVKAYDLLGYDAAAIGNHEFDFGPIGEDATVQHAGQDPRGALKARAAEAGFPFLSANILEGEEGASIAWPNTKGSTLISVKGIQVGIIGVSTFETPQVTLSANFAGLRMAPLVDAITSQARVLREAGAQIVIVTAHAGGICKELDDPSDLHSCDNSQEIFAVANALPTGAVQAIVAGHTHQAVAHQVNGIAIIESFARGHAFGRIDFRLDSQAQLSLAKIYPPHNLCVGEASPDCDAGEYEGQRVGKNAGVLAIATEAEKVATEIRAQPLGVELLAPVVRSRSDGSALGNLFADLMLEAKPSAQVAITNGGSLRADLPAGPLEYGSLFEAMPFDNRFAMVELRADQLATLIASNLQSDGGILSIAGVRAEAKCVEHKLRVLLKDARGRDILPRHPLIVATSDFLASGGDGLFSAEEMRIDMSDGTLIRDAMAEALRKRGGRIDPADTSLFDPKKPRIAFTGTRPLRCE